MQAFDRRRLCCAHTNDIHKLHAANREANEIMKKLGIRSGFFLARESHFTQNTRHHPWSPRNIVQSIILALLARIGRECAKVSPPTERRPTTTA